MARKQKDESGKTSTRKTKKEVDPNMPKKPLSAYFRYVAVKRSEVKKANPDLKLTEVTKKIGEMWGEEDKDVKDIYIKEYEKDKKEYDMKMAEYKKSHPTGKSVDPNMPKKPLTPYFMFAEEHRKEVKEANPDIKVTEISKELGDMWKKLSDEEKKPYTEKHAELKKQYDIAIKKYYEEHPEALKEKEEKKAASKAAKSAKKPKKECKPKARKVVEEEEEEEKSDSDIETESSENIFDNESD